MEEFSFEPEKVRKSSQPIKSEKKASTVVLTKIYVWFAVGLLLTGLVSLGLPNLLVLLLNESNAELISSVYLGTIIGSAVMLLVGMVVVTFQAFRKNFPVIVTGYMIYSVAMGVLLSAIFLFAVGPGEGLSTISLAFLITGGVFLICGVVGALTKKTNLNFLWPILMSVICGVLIISLINIFLNSSIIYWITDFVLLAVLIIEIALDFHNINKIAERVDFDSANNVAVYCAYVLYSDFIALFLRVLMYLLMTKDRN